MSNGQAKQTVCPHARQSLGHACFPALCRARVRLTSVLQQLGRQCGLLLFDLDHFKQVNDTYGHDVGDAVLKVVAETLVRSLRTLDLVGRWGGEEFLVLMPDVHAIDLGDLAERCRVLIARSSVACYTTWVSVTASIGATMLSHTDSAATAVRRADELMYQSKRSGGGRTTTG